MNRSAGTIQADGVHEHLCATLDGLLSPVEGRNGLCSVIPNTQELFDLLVTTTRRVTLLLVAAGIDDPDEIATRLGVTRQTIARHLRTLCKNELLRTVTRENGSRGYEIGDCVVAAFETESHISVRMTLSDDRIVIICENLPGGPPKPRH